ncbi:DUF4395 domain-containing protein [Pseudarthrobacter sp. P1]|uniref:DUF4395 domain-containing protein n=1 Tax=Pseudarthrobacter sp. P1 TaxID=3418418 RepID=UPI003CF06320
MSPIFEQVPAATGFIAPPAPSRLRRFFAFPNPVNEYAARCTAAIVVVLSLAALLTGAGWLLVAIAAGFVLRVAFGPRISPAALLSVKVLAPRFGAPRLVPGPPKRFAQGIGAAMSIAAAVLFFAGAPLGAWVLVGLLVVAASLEAFAGYCLGCAIFGALVRGGLVPASVCEACVDVSLRSR